MEPLSVVEPMFVGRFRHTMDAKNRITIPAPWRQGEIDKFFSIPNLKDRFLMVLPPGAMQEVVEKVERNGALRPQARQKFIRQFSSRAQMLTVDKAGRMVIPAEQCSQLQLRGEVMLVGNYHRIEVWNLENWAGWERASDEEGPSFDEVCDDLGI
jgi:MraZ protein